MEEVAKWAASHLLFSSRCVVNPLLAQARHEFPERMGDGRENDTLLPSAGMGRRSHKVAVPPIKATVNAAAA